MLVAALAVLLASPATDVVVAAFSNLAPGGRVAGWEPMRLGSVPASTYTVVRDGGAVVVRGTASRSASGLLRRVTADAARTPFLSWRWKVDGVIAGARLARRDGDDYAARLYVTFDYPVRRLSAGDRVRYRALRALGYRDIPTRALCYVWANDAADTRPARNPFSDWVQMVPVRSGARGAGAWTDERRNVEADYRAAFGEAPPPINGFAIMTDADNARASATGYFGDILLRAR